VLIVLANGVRLLASAGGALIAIYWLGLGGIGFFVEWQSDFAHSQQWPEHHAEGEGARQRTDRHCVNRQ